MFAPYCANALVKSLAYGGKEWRQEHLYGTLVHTKVQDVLKLHNDGRHRAKVG